MINPKLMLGESISFSLSCLISIKPCRALGHLAISQTYASLVLVCLSVHTVYDCVYLHVIIGKASHNAIYQTAPSFFISHKTIARTPFSTPSPVSWTIYLRHQETPKRLEAFWDWRALDGSPIQMSKKNNQFRGRALLLLK